MKMIKNFIRLISPNKSLYEFNEIMDALEGKRFFSMDTIQNIIIRLRDLFPDEISKIDRTKYKKWIEKNASIWKERIDSYQMEKLIYGIAKS